MMSLPINGGGYTIPVVIAGAGFQEAGECSFHAHCASHFLVNLRIQRVERVAWELPYAQQEFTCGTTAWSG